MKLEFIEDSPELQEFVKTLKWKDSIDYEGELDDYHTFTAIYFQESTNKYYKVEMNRSGGVYSKAKFTAYRRDFKTTEPYIVSFYEVVPVEVVRTEWVDVEMHKLL